MPLLISIREQIAPITIEGVILAIGYFTFMKMPPHGTVGDIVAWFLLLIAFCVVFSILPGICHHLWVVYGQPDLGALTWHIHTPCFLHRGIRRDLVPGSTSGRSFQNNPAYRTALRNLRACRVLCSTEDEKLPCGIRYSRLGVAHYLDGRVHLNFSTYLSYLSSRRNDPKKRFLFKSMGSLHIRRLDRTSAERASDHYYHSSSSNRMMHSRRSRSHNPYR